MSDEGADVRSGLQPDLRELAVDGVRVFHQPGPSKTRAVLFFGVGLQDETFETVGVTHLVEHLVMAQLPKSHLDANASVAVDHTVFYAHGRPDEVGAFLRTVCAALADLPLEHLAREKSVVLTEGTAGADLSMAAAWTARYGFDGPGLASTDGHGPLALTAEDVLDHAAAHFTAGRAALGVLGPLPDGLSLLLPPTTDTTAAPRRFPQPRLGDGPEWTRSPSPGVALLLDGLDPDDGAVRVAATALCERLEDVARTTRGLTYSVTSDVMDGPDGDVFTVALDFREGSAAEVAALVWHQLTDLATHGPTEAELEHVLAGYAAEADLGDEDVVEGEPFRRAMGTVLGAASRQRRLRSLAEIAEDVARTTREDVRDRLAAAGRRALLAVPEDVDLPEAAQQPARIDERSWCAVVPQLPPGRPLRPPALARLFTRAARCTLVLSEASIALRDETGDVHAVRWDEVAGVVPLPDAAPGVVVLGRNLCGIPVHPDAYGRATYEEVLRRLAPHVERMRRAAEAGQEQDRQQVDAVGPAVAGRR